ncbi:MAG: TerB family tellurite resistance protein [Gammaproteobacteria bacterium]|nr:TerB family tellurite resistance protein [Gammaproteobacteria bacterium]MBU1415508.1 TerB family tellurite resistance protein [Gammaproteobacteria bacterium]
MIAGLKEFFSQFIEPGTETDDTGDEHALQVATAALLLEMMRMDSHIDEEERAAIAEVMREQFRLDADEFAAIRNLAEQAAQKAHDYYQFTSMINQRCDAAQKVRIVENLWRVAMADGHLDAHELHLMRKLADLLHVGHADYVAAKQRAREAAKLPPG